MRTEDVPSGGKLTDRPLVIRCNRGALAYLDIILTYYRRERSQPIGANMGILPDLGVRIKDKQERYQAVADRDLEQLNIYLTIDN